MPCALAARQNAAAGLHESARGVVLGRVLLVGVVVELQAELRLGEEDSPLYPAGSGFVESHSFFERRGYFFVFESLVLE